MSAERVSIDPEDREQVERLLLAYGVVNEAGNVQRCADKMQAALRQLAQPKPDEPLSLGAVVEDTGGDLWVRASNLDPEWRTDAHSAWSAWAGIDAARVLSEGWIA